MKSLDDLVPATLHWCAGGLLLIALTARLAGVFG